MWERASESAGRLIPAHAGKTRPRSRVFRGRRAHPRSRGENGKARTDSLDQSGSSPLTRGKPITVNKVRRIRGLIPAHAGKTERYDVCRVTAPAHPRSRGENPTRLPRGGRASGSSPLTRGKPTDEICCCVGHGLIPAHAGKTRYRVRSRHRLGAHPRSRGENESRHSDNPEAVGSSPLTRGKPSLPCSHAAPCRLIPAHAGKTRPLTPIARSRPAHPRSRGENR